MKKIVLSPNLMLQQTDEEGYNYTQCERDSSTARKKCFFKG
jgi:hypothetical protein